MDFAAGYKMTEVGIIPEDWEVCKLGEKAFIAPTTMAYTSHSDQFIHRITYVIMKKILYLIICSLCLVSCNKQQAVKQESETDIRAKSDTTLSFKGIVLGETIDSVLVDSIKKGEVILIDGSVEYKMSGPSIYDFVDNPTKKNEGKAEHIVLSTYESQPLGLMPLVALYEDAYGEFSFMQTDHHQAETTGYMVFGEIRDDGQPITRKDVVDTFLEMALFVKKNPQNLISFSFVWEWKDKSIIIRYEPYKTNETNTFVEYIHRGYTKRMQAIENENQRIDSIQNASSERRKAIEKSQDI